jgi:hypothetical protein
MAMVPTEGHGTDRLGRGTSDVFLAVNEVENAEFIGQSDIIRSIRRMFQRANKEERKGSQRKQDSTRTSSEQPTPNRPRDPNYGMSPARVPMAPVPGSQPIPMGLGHQNIPTFACLALLEHAS